MARRSRSVGPSALCALLVCALAAGAQASPWTLPERVTVLSLSTDVQYARQEFLPDGAHQNFPVDGQFYSTNVRLGLRYGISDTLEIGAEISVGLLDYEADEIYLAPDPAAQDISIGDVRANVLSFDSQQVGPGDLYLEARQRFFTAPHSVLTGELNVKLPTGYAQPGLAGGNLPPTLVNDVTLGDGQMDVTGLLLLGIVPTGTWFLRLDAGFRARFFGPGHQIVGAFKFGGRVLDSWVPFISADAVHSITEGDVVGQSFVTDFPDTPATEFSADLIRPIDLRLDRTVVRAGIGSIVTVGNMDLNLSYTYVVWGQNTAQLHIVSFGTAFTL